MVGWFGVEALYPLESGIERQDPAVRPVVRSRRREYRACRTPLAAARTPTAYEPRGQSRSSLTYVSRRLYAESVSRPNTVRTSLDIPVPLHDRLHEAARRRGCSARQLILGYMERLVAEELPGEPLRVKLPLVPAAGRGVIADVTNDEALFG